MNVSNYRLFRATYSWPLHICNINRAEKGGHNMPRIQILVDGEIVHSEEYGGGQSEEATPSHEAPTLGHDDVTEAQARRTEGGGVYFQARFGDGSRQSIHLENPNVNGLEDTFEESGKATRLSFAGSGNHFYTPATIVDGFHVFVDNIHVGDLPDGWDDGRKGS